MGIFLAKPITYHVPFELAPDPPTMVAKEWQNPEQEEITEDVAESVHIGDLSMSLRKKITPVDADGRDCPAVFAVCALYSLLYRISQPTQMTPSGGYIVSCIRDDRKLSNDDAKNRSPADRCTLPPASPGICMQEAIETTRHHGICNFALYPDKSGIKAASTEALVDANSEPIFVSQRLVNVKASLLGALREGRPFIFSFPYFGLSPHVAIMRAGIVARRALSPADRGLHPKAISVTPVHTTAVAVGYDSASDTFYGYVCGVYGGPAGSYVSFTASQLQEPFCCRDFWSGIIIDESQGVRGALGPVLTQTPDTDKGSGDDTASGDEESYENIKSAILQAPTPVA